MLAKRIIACLDVRDGLVVKGTKFKDHEVMGEIMDFSLRYRDEGIDELVFYDIAASSDGKRISRDWVRRVARILNIPFCVAGGIRSVSDAAELLENGADKISINTPAIENPGLITELAREFGSQCVVVGVDSKRGPLGFEVYSHTGRTETIKNSELYTMEWIKEAQERGAGEIVLNCMDRDGTGEGYDVTQLKIARDILSIPLIASGGAKQKEDFLNVFVQSQVDGALAARAFHQRTLDIAELKNFLKEQKIEMRI